MLYHVCFAGKLGVGLGRIFMDENRVVLGILVAVGVVS